MKTIFDKIKEHLLPFNYHTCKGLRFKQMESIISFIDQMWKDIIEVINKPDVKYLGYKIYTPSEYFKYLIKKSSFKHDGNKTAKYIIMHDTEAILVEFLFQVKDKVIDTQAFFPFYYDKFCLIVSGAEYLLHWHMSDRLYFRITKGINIKTRLPIEFWYADKTFAFEDVVSKKLFLENIIITGIHRKSTKKVSIMHYLLAKFGLYEVLKIFGLYDKVKIVNKIGNVNKYYHFELKKNLYLQVPKEIMEDYISKKVIAHILYCFPKQFENIEIESNINTQSLFKLVLGSYIYPKKNIKFTVYQANIHLKTIESYIDTLCLKRLSVLGIKDIYDLMIFVFKEFEKLSVTLKPNDIFIRRVTTIEHILELYIQDTYRTLFDYINNEDSNAEKLLNQIFKKLPTKGITKINQVDAKSSISSVYNNLTLLNFLRANDSFKAKKKGLDLLEVTVFKWNPHIYTIKCASFYSTSKPESNLTLNPYATIDDHGIIEKNEPLCNLLDKQLAKKHTVPNF